MVKAPRPQGTETPAWHPKNAVGGRSDLRAGTAAELWPRLWGGSGEIRFPKLPLESLGMSEGEAELADGACGGSQGINLQGWEARPHLLVSFWPYKSCAVCARTPSGPLPRV